MYANFLSHSNRTLKAITQLIFLSALFAPQGYAAKFDLDSQSEVIFPSFDSNKALPGLESGEVYQGTDDVKLLESEDDSIRNLLRNGILHFRAGDITKGLNELKQAWEKAPNMPSTSVTLGMHYVKAKKYSEALGIAKKQKEFFPDKPYAFILEGFAYQGLGEKDRSIAAFNQALKMSPGEPVASAALADYAVSEKNTDKARDLYLAALKHHPDSLSTLLLLIRLDNPLKKDTRETEMLVEKAVQASPDTPFTHKTVAYAYFLLKQYSHAVAEINKALAVESNAPTQFQLAQYLAYDGQMKASSEILHTLMKQYPDKVAPKALAGRLALAQKQPEEAVKLFKEAYALQDTTDIALQLTLAQIATGDKQSAFITLENQVKKFPKDAVLRGRYAELLRKNDRQQEAIQQYKEILSLTPGDPYIKNNLAWLHFEQGDLKAAMQQAEAAKDIAPNDPKILDTYGVMLMKNNQFSMAVEIFQKALKEQPDNTTVRIHLAEALAKTDKIDQSRILLKELIKHTDSLEERQSAEELLNKLESH
ncbi:tetratricopeptide repeat protein [Methylomonas montana]|uniref:tetratricopeptide repeat protein n=1 Tax=Methylomonas montana TaxID=3058963 RepID=UPI0026597A74|nr:tetratricopeptide repeat protein [Methylomonas montana]WKJ89573.1 tetratricopeptide repeat protein [Methylomonas montana]